MNNQKENIIRINKVKKNIEKNLEQELLLSELASIASFSPFHFQRIFKSIVGKTLSVTIIFGWLASRIPARNAVKVTTREALSYE